jgi:hypothetical protein
MRTLMQTGGFDGKVALLGYGTRNQDWTWKGWLA